MLTEYDRSNSFLNNSFLHFYIFHIDLQSGKKSKTSPIIMKSKFQELRLHYTDYKHIYTDGFKDDMKVGCAVVSDDYSETENSRWVLNIYSSWGAAPWWRLPRKRATGGGPRPTKQSLGPPLCGPSFFG